MADVYLWAIRVERRLTLVELSKLCGIGKSTLSNIEAEKTSPTLNQLEKLAKALKVGIEDVYDSPLKQHKCGKTDTLFLNYGNIPKKRDKQK